MSNEYEHTPLTKDIVRRVIEEPFSDLGPAKDAYLRHLYGFEDGEDRTIEEASAAFEIRPEEGAAIAAEGVDHWWTQMREIFRNVQSDLNIPDLPDQP